MDIQTAQPTSWGNRWRESKLIKALGPGILVACAAVGGSHLVWSTRAGAQFGWGLVGLVLLANLLKYPFFLYGQRYTAATGESLLAGYYRHGKRYLYIFLAINILTGTINVAGVAMLSAALLGGYGILPLSLPHLTVGIMLVCAMLLIFGSYRLLDTLAKWIICLLAVGTLIAMVLAWQHQAPMAVNFAAPSPWEWGSMAFLVMLLGWMPAPIDLSAWSSLWIFSREQQTGHFATVRETSIDFYLGYCSAVVLAVVFLALGKLVMFGSGQAFSDSGIAFSHQLVSLYTSTIGEWSRPLILSMAFITMFSTTLTAMDGYPRSLAACCALIGKLETRRFKQIHQFWILLTTISGALIVLAFVANLLQLLSFAAVISFLTSPVLAYINYRVMNGPNVPVEQRPGPILKFLSWSGLLFFVLMSGGYVYVTFFRLP